MIRNFRVLALFLPLMLGGCALGDGIAHVAKLVGKKTDSASASPAAPAPAPAEAARPVDRDPPPAPAAAPRDEIKVETLPPQAR
jgi:hypothetical protein